MVSLSVIVLVLDENGIRAFEREGQPPVFIDTHGPMTCEFALEGVQPPPGQMHIRGSRRSIEPSKLQSEALGVLRLDARL
jgi:hypothetical protein